MPRRFTLPLGAITDTAIWRLRWHVDSSIFWFPPARLRPDDCAQSQAYVALETWPPIRPIIPNAFASPPTGRKSCHGRRRSGDWGGLDWFASYDTIGNSAQNSAGTMSRSAGANPSRCAGRADPYGSSGLGHQLRRPQRPFSRIPWMMRRAQAMALAGWPSSAITPPPTPGIRTCSTRSKALVTRRFAASVCISSASASHRGSGARSVA